MLRQTLVFCSPSPGSLTFSSANAEHCETTSPTTRQDDDDIPPPLPASRPPIIVPTSRLESVPYFQVDNSGTSSRYLNGDVQTHSGLTTPCFSIVSCSFDSEDETSKTISEIGAEDKSEEGSETSEESIVGLLRDPSKKSDLENFRWYDSHIVNNRDLSSSRLASIGAAPLPGKPTTLPPIGLASFRQSNGNRGEEETENSKSKKEHNRTFQNIGRGKVSNESHRLFPTNEPRLMTLPSQQLLSVYDRQTSRLLTRATSAEQPSHPKDLTTAGAKEYNQKTTKNNSTKSSPSLGYQRYFSSPAQNSERCGSENRLHLTPDVSPFLISRLSKTEISASVASPDRIPMSNVPAGKTVGQYPASCSDSTKDLSIAKESERGRFNDTVTTRFFCDSGPSEWKPVSTGKSSNSNQSSTTVSKTTTNQSPKQNVNGDEIVGSDGAGNLPSRSTRHSAGPSPDEHSDKSMRGERHQSDHRNDQWNGASDPAVKGRDLKHTWRTSSYEDRPLATNTNGRSHHSEHMSQSNEHGLDITSKGNSNQGHNSQGSVGQSSQTDKSRTLNRGHSKESSFEQLEKKLRDDARGRIQRLLVSPGIGHSGHASTSITPVPMLPIIAKPKPSKCVLLTKDERKSVPYEAVMSPRYRFKSPTTEFRSSAVPWGDADANSTPRTKSVEGPSGWGTRSLPRNMGSINRWSVSQYEDFFAPVDDASDARISISSTDSSLRSVSNASDSNPRRKEDGLRDSKIPQIYPATRISSDDTTCYAAADSQSETWTDGYRYQGSDRKGIETPLEVSGSYCVSIAHTPAVHTLPRLPSQTPSVILAATSEKPASRTFHSSRNFYVSPVYVHDPSSGPYVSPPPDGPFVSSPTEARPSPPLSLQNSRITEGSSSPASDIPDTRHSPKAEPSTYHISPLNNQLLPNVYSPHTSLSLRASVAPPQHVHPFAKINHTIPPPTPASDASRSYSANDLSSNFVNYSPHIFTVLSSTLPTSSVPKSPGSAASNNRPIPRRHYPGSSTFISHRHLPLTPNSPEGSASNDVLGNRSPLQASFMPLSHWPVSPCSPHSSVAPVSISDSEFDPDVPPPLPAVAPPFSFPAGHRPRPAHGAPLDNLFSVTENHSDPRHCTRPSNPRNIFPMPKSSTKSVVTTNEKRNVTTNEEAQVEGEQMRPEGKTLQGSEPDKSFTYFPMSNSRAGSGIDRDKEWVPSSFYKSSLSISLLPFVDLDDNDDDDDDGTGSVRVNSQISEDGTGIGDRIMGELDVNPLQSTVRNRSMVNHLQSSASSGSQVNHFQSAIQSEFNINHLQSAAQGGSQISCLQSPAQSESKESQRQPTTDTGTEINHFQSTAQHGSKVNNPQLAAQNGSKDNPNQTTDQIRIMDSQFQLTSKSRSNANHDQPKTQPESAVNCLQPTFPSGSKVNNLQPTAQCESKIRHLKSATPRPRTAYVMGSDVSNPRKASTPRPSSALAKRNGTDGATLRNSLESVGRKEAPNQTERRACSDFPNPEMSGQHPVGNDDSSLLEIDIVKGSIGICFCLEGGRDSPYGDGPIRIKRIFSGTPSFSVGKERLRPGDELISVNGEDLTAATHYTAWTFLRALPAGLIRLVVRRNSPP